MDLDLLPGATELAGVGQQPREELRTPGPDLVHRVVEDRVLLSGERDAAPPHHERGLPFAPLLDLEALAWAAGRLECSPEAGVDLADADAQLVRQRLGQRRLHDPLQTT